MFSPVLRKGLQEGKVAPVFFSTVQDLGSHIQERAYYGSSRYISYAGALYKNKSIPHKGSQYNYRNISKNRKSIYLCPIKDLERKIHYNISNPESDFRIFGLYNTISTFANKETETSFYRNSILIRIL